MFYPMANVLCLLVIFGQPGPSANDNPVSKHQRETPHLLTNFDGNQRISSPSEITPPQDRWALSEKTNGNIDQDQSSSPLTMDRPADQQSLDSNENFPSILESNLNRDVYRDVTPKWVTIKSDDFQHRHLLFEEADFERHGVGRASKSRQFLESTTRFFGRGLFLPATTLRGKPWQWQVAPGK